MPEDKASQRASSRSDASSPASAYAPPKLELPKGGGAIRGIGEKFASNPVNGTSSMSVPIAVSPGRSGFAPELTLAYDSGAGNGIFGFGWSLSLPAITRKTEKGLPRYLDQGETDVYLLADAEDLVPLLTPDGTRFEDERGTPGFRIHRYRPRIDRAFSRIERWTDLASGEIHWRTITRDNVSTLYGRTPQSRIADPSDPLRIFKWLICERHDCKGNAIVYEYAAENGERVDRVQARERRHGCTSNRYPKRILYGNRTSALVDPDLARNDWLFEVVFDYGEGHCVELPLDRTVDEAAQHRRIYASATPAHPWAVRPDPFSTHRAGFEIRTYRRCQRVLMFHRFSELGVHPCLVYSTDFDYADLDYAAEPSIDAELAHQGSTRFASFMRAVSKSGYVRDDALARPAMRNAGGDTYLGKSLPPLEFEYSRAVLHEDIRQLDAASLENLPIGLDGGAYHWVDLDGEGLSGILTEQAGAWFYKANLGEGRFGPVETTESKPSSISLGARGQLLDVAGDGQLDVVALARPVQGFYERTQDRRWTPFRPFQTMPEIAWEDGNLRFVDLNGDGLADLLITENEVFTWHASLAEDGFGVAHQVSPAFDDEDGPRLVFADGTQSLYLADMCGDGLTDLVRIRNGEVCYWPNQGYGHFGAKVVMDNAPWFDTPEGFSQQRIRLADIDGSGTSDIIYLGSDGVRLYLNQCGNRLSEPRWLRGFPKVDGLSMVMPVDLLGNGTACLVWSSPLPGDARRPLRYIDLMGGQKPHLLIRWENNLGAETRLHYAASTKFYLADKRAGKAWITRLPFPVHVLERVETFDHISRNRFVNRFSYHHGYFDGVEREFRGFGMVERWDSETFAAFVNDLAPADATNLDSASHVPPTYTRTWYHVGVYMGRDQVSNFFAGLIDPHVRGEYFREPGQSDAAARRNLLPDTILPPGLTPQEEREACRALRGSMLRQEIYALDASDKASIPYTATEQNFTLRQLQPCGANRHAVFFTHPRESVVYHYERNPLDPRVMHTLTLEVDEYGNVLKEAAIGYGRRLPDPSLARSDQDTQAKLFVTYSENDVTNAVDEANAYRAPLTCETRAYEVTGLALASDQSRFTLAQVADAGARAAIIACEQKPGRGMLQKRVIEHRRTLFRRDDLAGPLPLGELEVLALPFEAYRLALTPGLLKATFGGRVTDAMLAAGGYVRSEGEAAWWIPSGQVFLSPDSTHTAAEELHHARRHFFLPLRYRDPFHTDAVATETVVTYDRYDLLPVATRDALGNTLTVVTRDDRGATTLGNDYRVLKPCSMTDANGNRTCAAFDALGRVVGTATMGKPPPAPVEGDSLDGFEADLADAVIAKHLDNPLADAASLLQRATTRLIYDFSAYHHTKAERNPKPVVVHVLSREMHDSQLSPTTSLRIQHTFSYFDGYSREIQRKTRAPQGIVPRRDASGAIVTGADGQPEMTIDHASTRWVGSGWTVFDNKGNAVRQFEPFFTDRHGFERDVRVGVSPVLFYDPAERLVATLGPNRTWEKVVFDAWRHERWDVNDTALIDDPRADPDVGGFFRRLDETQYLPTWYAQRIDGALGPDEQAAARMVAVHAGTPSIVHADALGRAFLTVAHNRFRCGGDDAADRVAAEHSATRRVLDIEGNEREVIDANDRIAMRYDYDMIGRRIHQINMEAGERWMLDDATGKSIYAWDGRDHRLRTTYDALRRSLALFVQHAADEEILAERSVYGETQPESEARNLRGKLVQKFDQAGVVATDDYDFKGNVLSRRRTLAQAYKGPLDWSMAPALQPDVFTHSTTYDALNRPLSLVTPDHSIYRPAYNEASLLHKVDVGLRGAQTATPFVTRIDYDAKGQRVRVDCANGIKTEYAYDPLTFRLVDHSTTRSSDRAALLSLHYTYDPCGNVTRIVNGAQQTIYFSNQVVCADNDYAYDALYRLVAAAGREHIGQAGHSETSWDDRFRVHRPQPGDGQAMRRYAERYTYDRVGHLLNVNHQAANGNWTRGYAYDEPSLIEPTKASNRLSSTNVGANRPDCYAHDVHGNMIAMPHLALMQWNFKDHLVATARQVVIDGTPETTYYVYDAAGKRVRKVTERENGTRCNERVYLDGFEVYREYDGSGNRVTLERETLHVMSDTARVALIETKTVDSASPLADASPFTRYQLSNHLGSVSLELDVQARIISYEEYMPYGSTSYQAVRNGTETPKRYRFTGKERDEETGLGYHEARYFAPWLGRWISCDPLGPKGGIDLYVYARSNPTGFIDPKGTDDLPSWYRTDQQIVDILQEIEDTERLLALSGTLLRGDQSNGAENAYAVEGISLDPKQASVMAHHVGDLKFLVTVNLRFGVEAERKAEWEENHGYVDKLVTSYEKEKAYQAEKEKHRDWEVKPNFLLDITNEIVKATPGASANLWLIFAGSLGTAPKTPIPAAAAAVGADVFQILRNLGVVEEDLAAFARGEKVWVFSKKGGIDTTSYFQLKGGKLIAGVLNIKSPTAGVGNVATVRAIKSFLDQASSLARKVGAKTLRLEGNTVTNLGPKGMEGFLERLGFKVDPKDPGLMVRESTP